MRDDTLPAATGESIGTRGEDVAKSEDEPGDVDRGKHGESGRPAGGSTARKGSSVNPQDPIDPESPNMPVR